MPEREELIAQWRHNLAETTRCTSEVLDELESHLRDELQHLVQTGHSEEQAFTLAVSRLGPPRALATEFAKVAEPAAWLPIRFAMLAVGIAAALLVFSLFVLRWKVGPFDPLLAIHVGAVTLGYTISLIVGALVICYVVTRSFHDLTAGQVQGLKRAVIMLTTTSAALTLIGIILGAVWANDHLGCFWGWDPREVMASAVVIWDAVLVVLLIARVWEQRVILLGILGNGLVGFAWFGTVPHLRTAVIVFALMQLLLFGLGFLPAESLRKRSA